MSQTETAKTEFTLTTEDLLRRRHAGMKTAHQIRSETLRDMLKDVPSTTETWWKRLAHNIANRLATMSIRPDPRRTT